MAMRWRWPPDSRAPPSPTQGVVAVGQGGDEVVGGGRPGRRLDLVLAWRSGRA